MMNNFRKCCVFYNIFHIYPDEHPQGGGSRRSPPRESNILFGGLFPDYFGVFFLVEGPFILHLGGLVLPFGGHFLYMGELFSPYVEKFLCLSHIHKFLQAPMHNLAVKV